MPTMLIVIVTLLGGFAFGWSRRGRDRALRMIDHLMNATIYFFLLVLGMMVGCDPQTLGHLDRIGFHAFLIAAAGVTGSLAIAWLLTHTIMKDIKIEE